MIKGAMLMAWYLKGMNARELSTLTNTLTFSGKNKKI
jgi:thymidine phosphorylase